MDIERVNHVLGKAIVGLQADEIEAAASYVDETITVPRSIESWTFSRATEPSGG